MSLFGHTFRVSTFGESHGVGVGCIIDGMPAGVKLTEEDLQPQLTRRRPGQSSITTLRNEKDKVVILSGTENGKTLGTSIGLLVKNEDQRKHDYASTDVAPRPGHADYTYLAKYGAKASSGGGRASARETIGRVAAGAAADAWLTQEYGNVRTVCWVSQVMDLVLPPEQAKALEDNPPTREEVDVWGTLTHYETQPPVLVDHTKRRYDYKTGEPADGDAASVSIEGVEGKPIYTRCPHAPTAAKIIARLEQLRAEQDSTGGVATCVVLGSPVGLGEPCFDKLEAELAKAMMSLPATKGFEIGSGFSCAAMLGSQHNDRFEDAGEAGTNPDQAAAFVSRLLRPATNYAGGTLGGISTGKNIVMRVAIKPASSIAQAQVTAAYTGEDESLQVKGRHDPCVLARAPPLLEGMASIVIADAALRQRARQGCRPLLRLPEEEEGPGAKRARQSA